ncbi:sodium:phosphate symporter [Halorutilales archaeon Cl-col2-1]
MRRLPVWLVSLGTVALFVFSVQLLGGATQSLAPVIESILEEVVTGDGSALGLGWIASYLIANGSVVAAVAVSFVSVDLLTPSQTYLMVAGSRLGGAGIVMVIGGVDYLLDRQHPFGESVSLGSLSFVLTYSVYLPATVLGYLGKDSLYPVFETGVSSGYAYLGGGLSVSPFRYLIRLSLEFFGGFASAVLAVFLLFGSLRILDSLSETIDINLFRKNYLDHLRNRWLWLLFGLIVTAVTASVAFSIGITVPFYNRGYVKRKEMVPYILGANISTLFDTFVASLALTSPKGTTVIVYLFAVSTVVTVGILVFYDSYYAGVEYVHDRLVEDTRFLAGFLVVILGLPLGLLLV